MHAYDTVTAAINGLRSRGYDLDFNISENCLICKDARFAAEDFEISEVYRFEGDSDPADEAVVYGITSNKGHSGVLVTGYGASAEGIGAEIAKKLSIHKEAE